MDKIQRLLITMKYKIGNVNQEAEKQCLDYFVEVRLFAANRENLHNVGCGKTGQ